MSSERERIQIIKRIIGAPGPHVPLGIGDDTAIVVCPPNNQILFCSDLMSEGVHFDLKTTTALDLGYKALATGLSDIAAMNGIAHYAVVSLALPKATNDQFLTDFYLGAKEITQELGVEIVGGDLSSSRGGIFIDVALIGSVDPTSVKRRSGAQVGDLLVVSGHPGLSAAGLAALQNGVERSLCPHAIQKHLRPEPRFDLLPMLNTQPELCTSLIDVSDGLVSELYHLSRASAVAIDLDINTIRLHTELLTLAQTLNLSSHEQSHDGALNWALSGGEDYELLCTVNPTLWMKQAESHLPTQNEFQIIGRVSRALAVGESSRVDEIKPNGERSLLPHSGFDHFKNHEPKTD